MLDLSDAIKEMTKSINEEGNRLLDDAGVREGRSRHQRAYDIGFRATTAILAVASPALVTYSTTPDVPHSFKLAAILLSGLAGAAATLQAIFAFQQNYVRNAIDALDLYEIRQTLSSDTDAARRLANEYEQYAKMQAALDKATRSHKEVIMSRRRAELERALSSPT